MPDSLLSKLVVEGTTYEIKDAYARSQIAAKTSFKGILATETKSSLAPTPLTDGATTNPVVVKDGASANKSVTATAGDIVVGNGSDATSKDEFIFDGTKWQLMGSETQGLGSLAYKNSASATYTPAGSVSQPTFTGSSSSVTITAADNANGNYTPKGSISGIAWTGSSTTSTGSYTPEGSISFSNTNKTATVSAASSGTATYTPAGSVAAPTISVGTAGSTATVKSVKTNNTVVSAVTAGASPNNAISYSSYDSATETLTLNKIGYNTSSAVVTEDKTVKTGDATYTATAPAFTGTGVRLVTGNISVPNTASFTGTESTVTVTGTSAGSISSQGTFTGTKTQLSGTTTAAGTVSKPTFSGTQATITVQ